MAEGEEEGGGEGGKKLRKGEGRTEGGRGKETCCTESRIMFIPDCSKVNVSTGHVIGTA